MTSLIVTETDLRSCLPMDLETLSAVETAFTWIAEDRVVMPPVMHIDIDPQSAVDTKGACVQGLDHFAIKIATGFFGNPALGLPSCSSIIALINARTGLFDCIFLDNGYLMDLRTGLAGAVAARHLARPTVKTVGVVGTGVQARYQIESLALVRPFQRLLVFGRDTGRRDAYCIDMQRRLGIAVDPSDDLETMVRHSDIIVTTTPSTQPLIQADWLHPGLHITAMGSDLPGKQELDTELLRRADLLVCDTRAQCEIGGELQHLPRGGPARAVLELGQITSGSHTINRTETQITVCDLTGTGAQDTAIAVEAYRRVTSAGLGTRLG